MGASLGASLGTSLGAAPHGPSPRPSSRGGQPPEAPASPPAPGSAGLFGVVARRLAPKTPRRLAPSPPTPRPDGQDAAPALADPLLARAQAVLQMDAGPAKHRPDAPSGHLRRSSVGSFLAGLDLQAAGLLEGMAELKACLAGAVAARPGRAPRGGRRARGFVSPGVPQAEARRAHRAREQEGLRPQAAAVPGAPPAPRLLGETPRLPLALVGRGRSKGAARADAWLESMLQPGPPQPSARKPRDMTDLSDESVGSEASSLMGMSWHVPSWRDRVPSWLKKGLHGRHEPASSALIIIIIVIVITYYYYYYYYYY